MRLGTRRVVAILPLVTIGASPPPTPVAPLIKSTTEERFGHKIEIRTFSFPDISIATESLTIAQRKLLSLRFARFPADLAEATIECRIDADGKVDLHYLCWNDRTGYKSVAAVGTLLTALKMVKIPFPDFPALSDKKSEKIQRWISFSARVGRSEVPVPELPDGPIVDKVEIPGIEQMLQTVRYPASALRAEAGGRLTVLCKIQIDQSVFCSQEQFEPVQNSNYFNETAGMIGLSITAPKLLSTGKPSFGVRFRVTINFSVPK